MGMALPSGPVSLIVGPVNVEASGGRSNLTVILPIVPAAPLACESTMCSAPGAGGGV